MIDPQTGAVRQMIRRTQPVKRSWLRIRWALLKAWWKSFRLDWKIVKKQ